MRHQGIRIVLIVIEAFIGLSAIGGGIALLTGAFSTQWLPVAWLQSTLFSDYTIPGLILLIVIGGGMLLAAVTQFVQREWAVLLSAAMGREELAANLFRITQTEGRLRREQIVGEDAAIQAHYRVGREVRDTLKRLGATMPRGPSYGGIYSWGVGTTAPRQAEDPETTTKGPGCLILAFLS